MKESKLWPVVEKWLRKSHRCFETAIDTGIQYSRMDVVGIADTPGDLAGETETLVVEVKKGQTPFAKACGQGLSYKVYSNRVYLADIRQKSFDFKEISIASHLGIGLIQIKEGKCFEVLSSPYYQPMKGLNLALLEKLSHGKCQVCGSLFRLGEKRRYTNLIRVNEVLNQRIIEKAIGEKKGLVFWNLEVADRKHRLGLREVSDYSSYERRFICPDCTAVFMYRLTKKF